MAQPRSSQREVGNAQFGNNATVHQNNNTYNVHLPLEPVQPPIRIIPYPRNEDLVSRPDLVEKLNELLPQTPHEYFSAALWGLGGSGKTQIALNYAYQRCNRENCSVFWVHADSEATFSQDYKTIASAFGIDQKLKDRDLFAAVRDHIAARPDWVLILDNADDLRLFGVNGAPEQTKSLFQYIPRASTGTVLWTSRDAHIAVTLVGWRQSIEVARMNYDEAETLLKIAGSLEVEREKLEVIALLEELQWLPLAITQAGAYMRRTKTSAKKYSSLLAQSKIRWQLLKEEEFDRHRRDGVPNNVLETWSISIDRLKQDSEAYNVLHVIAYVASQNISHEIITAILKHSGIPPKDVEAEATKAITRLKEFSFLGMHQTEDGGRNYEMHKLVQEATRYGLSLCKSSELDQAPSNKEDEQYDPILYKSSDLDQAPSNKKDEQYFSGIAVRAIDGLFPDPEPETWTLCEKYLAHAVQIGDWTDLNKEWVKTSNLYNKVSVFLFDRGRWREREVINKKYLEFSRKIWGEDHRNTIISMDHLTTTYWAQGRYKEAEALEVQVLDLRREVLGDKHPDTIQSMADRALTFSDQGRYKEAEALEAQVLDLRREVLGDEHPDTIQSMANRASTYSDQGRYKEAEALEVQVLDLQQEILGDRHPDTIRSMANLASTYYRQGRYKKAKAIQARVLYLRREILGDKHPDTITVMANLATTYYYQGQYPKSMALEFQALNLRRDILGDKHPDTIRSMINLTLAYYRQGQYKKAESLAVQALNLARGILGTKHPDTLRAMHNLACTWRAQGRLSNALALMEKCAQYRHSVLGSEHPDTVISAEHFARWKSEDDRLESDRIDSQSEQNERGSEQAGTNGSIMGRIWGWFR